MLSDSRHHWRNRFKHTAVTSRITGDRILVVYHTCNMVKNSEFAQTDWNSIPSSEAERDLINKFQITVIFIYCRISLSHTVGHFAIKETVRGKIPPLWGIVGGDSDGDIKGPRKHWSHSPYRGQIDDRCYRGNMWETYWLPNQHNKCMMLCYGPCVKQMQWQ